MESVCACVYLSMYTADVSIYEHSQQQEKLLEKYHPPLSRMRLPCVYLCVCVCVCVCVRLSVSQWEGAVGTHTHSPLNVTALALGYCICQYVQYIIMK